MIHVTLTWIVCLYSIFNSLSIQYLESEMIFVKEACKYEFHSSTLKLLLSQTLHKNGKIFVHMMQLWMLKVVVLVCVCMCVVFFLLSCLDYLSICINEMRMIHSVHKYTMDDYSDLPKLIFLLLASQVEYRGGREQIWSLDS